MAEIVYKKISELDTGTVPLDGGELIMVSQTGVSKKATILQAHGAGWWNVLKVALSSFIAPEATHAVDSDTCGEETPADFHDAAQLTGNIHLDRIPEELTGKNASTATLASTATKHNTLLNKVIEIGDWNMDSTASKSVAHGLGSSYKKIRSVSVVIFNDNDTSVKDLRDSHNAATGSIADGNIDTINLTNVVLYRTTGGSFDGTDYDATSFNRGYITIWYVE